ncbi:MAG: hypothetical protein AAFN93_15930 [Bacteroidota bacterium]
MIRKLSVLIALIIATHFSVAQLFQKQLENPFSKYSVSTKTCTKLIHSTGSIIFIPDHAFGLGKGAGIDSVDIFYREIRTPLEMIAHDIPMTFNVMNKRYHLESSGMFEIWAMYGADTIGIHEDRSIEVRLAVAPQDLDIRTEGYSLKRGADNWESYTSRLGFNSIVDDDDLWGSNPVDEEEIIEEDIFFEDEEGTAWVASNSGRNVAFQAMEIFDFGFYNYDRIIEDQIYVKIEATFVDENAEAIKSPVYIVYDEINSVFEYPAYTWEDQFSLIKNMPYKLFSVDNDGKIMILKDFPNLNSAHNQSYTFELKTNEKVPNTKQELASITGLR